MAKLYSRINWVDYPSVTTPMNATNFNKMDKGIDDLDNSLNNLTTVYTDLVEDVADFTTDLSNLENKINYNLSVLGQHVPCFIPIGATFTIYTASGANFTPTKVDVLDQNEVYIDWYSLSSQIKNSRTLTWNGSKDIYYLRILGGTAQDIIVNVNLKVSSTLEDFRKKINNNSTNLRTIIPPILPRYYDTYMSWRIATVQNLETQIGLYGDSFIFITDTHMQNAFNSPSMARKIVENTSVDRVFLGGDYINEPNTKELTYNGLRTVLQKFRTICDNVTTLRGNHDDGHYGGIPDISSIELYPILSKPNRKNVISDYSLFYYTDNSFQKIRYYTLDSGRDGAISATQSQWLNTTASSLSSDWTIVVFVHHGIKNSGVIDDRTNISLYPAGQTIVTALTGISAKVACVMCGHIHIDISYNVGNYNFIGVTCDAYGSQSASGSTDVRTAGTIYEQAFDVVHIDKTNKKVYCTRFGGGQNTVTNDTRLNDRVFSYI